MLIWYKLFQQKDCIQLWLRRCNHLLFQTQLGNVEVVKLLLQTLQNEDLECRINLNARGGFKKQTALHNVSSVEIAQLLLKTLENKDVGSRVNLNARDNANCTALHLACRRGLTEIVKLFLKTLRNKDVNCRIDLNTRLKHSKKTALHVACEKGCVEIVSLLLLTLKNEDVKARIDINCPRDYRDLNARYETGETAFDVALRKGFDLLSIMP